MRGASVQTSCWKICLHKIAMASTRKPLCRAEFCLDQLENHQELAYQLYHHSARGRPANPGLPCLGITPSRMSRDQLCNNSTDVESRLMGLGTGNMMRPDQITIPELKGIAPVAFFDRIQLQRPALGGVPSQPHQRPFPIPQ